jgi:uncharacterized membrane protein YkvA (DUF1232 family)
MWTWLAITVALYAALVAALMLAGRRETARRVAMFIPECVALVRRLLTDPAVPRRHKLLLVALLAYLASPIDLVPDFVPIAGQLDDAILVALVLRVVLPGATVRSAPWHKTTTSPASRSPGARMSGASTS